MAQFDVWDTCDALITILRADMSVSCNVQLGEPLGIEDEVQVVQVYPARDTETATGVGAEYYRETQTIEVWCLVVWANTRANMNLIRNLASDVKDVIRADAGGRRLDTPNNIEEVSVATEWFVDDIGEVKHRIARLTLTCLVQPGA